MSAVARRGVVIGGAALVASMPFAFGARLARADAPRTLLSGSLKQGGLVVGKTEANAKVSVDGNSVRVSPEGLFAFGLAFDQKTPSHISVLFSDGSIESHDVAPVVRQYEVQIVNGLPPESVKPTPEEEARIHREHEIVAEARKRDSDATWFGEPFDWPAHGIISGLFGSQRILNGTPSAPHFGVDIAAGEGASIHAPANGTVLVADGFFLEGNFTMLDHGHGVFTSYMHQSKLVVKPGDSVERGQEIGRVGHTGRATGPHLHWGMNWFQVRLDPSLSARSPAPTKA